jgi:hypothetical protein
MTEQELRDLDNFIERVYIVMANTPSWFFKYPKDIIKNQLCGPFGYEYKLSYTEMLRKHSKDLERLEDENV